MLDFFWPKTYVRSIDNETTVRPRWMIGLIEKLCNYDSNNANDIMFKLSEWSYPLVEEFWLLTSEYLI